MITNLTRVNQNEIYRRIQMANPYHLKIMKLESSSTWNDWRSTNMINQPDLAEADLSRMAMTGIDISNGNFEGTKMLLSDFSDSVIVSTNFWMASMIAVNLSGCNLLESRFVNANLIRANLSKSNLSFADFSNAKLNQAKLQSCTFYGARMFKTELQRADLSNAKLFAANLSHANLAKSNLSSAVLAEANLVRANLSNANLSGADFSGAKMRGANLRGAVLVNVNFNRADLRHADLAGATLINCDLRQAELDQAQLPQSDTKGLKRLVGLCKSWNFRRLSPTLANLAHSEKGHSKAPQPYQNGAKAFQGRNEAAVDLLLNHIAVLRDVHGLITQSSDLKPKDAAQNRKINGQNKK